VKINVDAAVEKVEVGGAVGAVCRAEDGTFLGASVLKVRGINDPAILEAIACREAMALAEDLYERKVTVATDCLSVVNNMEQAYDGSYTMVISEVKARAQTLGEVTFRHENRASNSEAHNLARLAVFSGGRQVWLVEPVMVFLSRTIFVINKELCFPYKKMVRSFCPKGYPHEAGTTAPGPPEFPSSAFACTPLPVPPAGSPL
jgi:ribonuclease HI